MGEQFCFQVEWDRSRGWEFAQREERFKRGDAERWAQKGCDPYQRWLPITYKTDVCWGPKPIKGKCHFEGQRQQHLMIVLRSVADPFITVEQLTANSFDFGFGSTTQLIAGIVLMACGCMILACRRWARCC